MPFVTWNCECRGNHVAVAQSRDADPAYSEWSGRLPGGGTGPKRNLTFVCRGETHFLLKVLSWRIWEWDSDLVCCICGGILGCLYVVGRRGQRGNALSGKVAVGVTSMVLLLTPGNLCYRAETETTVLLSCPHPTVTTQSPSRPEEFLRSPKEVSSSQCCCQCVQGA